MTAAQFSDEDNAWLVSLPPSVPLDSNGLIVRTGDDEDEDDIDIVNSTDKTEIINPAPNSCAKCGLEIVRIPGTRGRLPKYHPECKPTGKSSQPRQTSIRVAKAEEAKAHAVDQIVQRFGRALRKAVIMLSIAQPYDAFVIHVNAPEVLENLENLLMKNDKLRAMATSADTGGSAIALITSLMAMGLPIAANHGMLGRGRAAELILNAPMWIQRLHNAEENAEGDFTGELLNRIRSAQREAAARRAAHDNTVRSSYANTPQSAS